MKTVKNSEVTYRVGSFCSIRATITFSRRILLHVVGWFSQSVIQSVCLSVKEEDKRFLSDNTKAIPWNLIH
jgi:hypothetical protein